ncbi:MAG: undecaprenyl-diphosphatase [Alphaproteobacteria bacterium]|nr:undecaprenyl-diphosphatase [Alphaproteobacteria bacterium]|tara:strand:+ start:1332 stop:2159 length:828 start_codon:yes stop_codon:yes gene_type:complete
MLLIHLLILALVQGITEFLPISSSGHLVLAHWLMQGQDAANNYAENHLLDIAVHIGTLAAVILYFRADFVKLVKGTKDTLLNHKTENRNLTLLVLISSIPVIILGFILSAWPIALMNSLYVIAVANIFFGILLWFSDRHPVEKNVEELTWKGALIIGFSQALALIPGTSRSGITMTAARFLNFSREEAARYSLLLAMVAISGAGLLGSLKLWESGNLTLGIDLLIAAAFAFAAAYFAILCMMKWLGKATFTPFVIYRIIFGIVLLGLLFNGYFGA